MRGLAKLLLVGCAALACGCTAASAVSRGYNINTNDITCEEANRYVQQALGDMNMTVTEFRKARPGVAGFAKAYREDARGGLSGTVEVRCDDKGVHILPDESGFLTTRDFERGLFLSVAGRADLVVEREGRYSTGVLHKRRQDPRAVVVSEATSNPKSDARARGAPAPQGGVEVHIELIRGFATVLDFEANVSAVAILPTKITVENKTVRTYDFDPRNLVLRKKGSREAAEPLGAKAAVERLRLAAEGAGGQKSEDLGDLAAASRIIPEREIKAARLAPGQTVEGYVYFPAGDYERARLTMTDVATGETEGFMVEF